MPNVPDEMSGSRLPISVIILTYNEEANIAACLQSVAGWAAEVFVVDSGSTDCTVELASSYGAHVQYHPWQTYSNQFNWALDNLALSTPWVMRLDADETVTPELARELAEKLQGLPDDVHGIYIKRRVYFMGRWIRHGGYYPTWLMRIFRRARARCEDRWMDEHMALSNGRVCHLEHDIIDYNCKGLSFWTIKHEDYARREALDVMGTATADQGRGIPASLLATQDRRRRWLKKNLYGRIPLFVRAFAYFCYRYFLRLGFLDGTEGLIFHFLQGCWYRFYVDAKLWEARRSSVKPAPRP